MAGAYCGFEVRETLSHGRKYQSDELTVELL
jgi:hypothetical protein